MGNAFALDTNLALLLAVGAEDRALIARHKRLAAYEAADYDLLVIILDTADGIVFCPNVVSETSNLIRYADIRSRQPIAATFGRIVQATTERYVPSADAAKHDTYLKLGMTDAVLMTLAESGATLLTDDLDLYLAAANAGHSVINFNHEREARF